VSLTLSIAAMVTYYAINVTAICLAMIGYLCDTNIDEEWWY